MGKEIFIEFWILGFRFFAKFGGKSERVLLEEKIRRRSVAAGFNKAFYSNVFFGPEPRYYRGRKLKEYFRGKRNRKF